ncbi:MAG: FecR family protein [Treponema sp.]|jgi:hypothetical protein|nr:FecR family protein [Treponema sp.]
MKKILCASVMLSVISAFVYAESGIIREFSGDVQLKHSGSSTFVPAQSGSEVAQDTVVSTGFKSTAIIAVGSSTVVVQPLTRLSLAEIQTSAGTETINMNLQSGRVKVEVKPPAGTKANFSVQSPSATASVRGTSFEFDTRNLKVSEGTVSFLGGDGIIMLVSAGGESFVGNDGRAADPVTIIAESVQPPPPPGTDSGGKTPVTPVTGDFSIKLQYP